MTLDLERVAAGMLRRVDRPEIAGVRSIVANGVDLSVVTNGWVAVVLPGQWPAAKPLTIQPAAADLLSVTPADVVPIDVAALRRLVDAIPFNALCPVCSDGPLPPCSECDGSGYTECECMSCGDTHERRCEECGGRRGRCPRCQSTAVHPTVAIGGSQFSNSRLQEALRWVPDDGVAFGFKPVTGDGVPAGVFVAPAWWVVVMAIRPSGQSPDQVFELAGACAP